MTNKTKIVLGISAFYHDSSAVLILDGKVIAAAQEERFNRIKNTDVFPIQSIKYCLSQGNTTLANLDAVVYYEKPMLKFERILFTYYAFAPKGIISFILSMPKWVNRKLFMKKIIRDELSSIEEFDTKKLKILFSEHHLSHAACAFFTSSMHNSAILTIDGVGEWTTTSIGLGNGNSISVLKEMHFPHSIGLLYSSFTLFLGFKVNSGEYKLMGLAPYGNINSQETNDFIYKIKKYLVDIKDDGSFYLHQIYFNYCTGLSMIHKKRWEKLFGIECRIPESKIEQSHCNLALAIQHVTEEIIFRLAKEAKRITNSENLCMSGGVALNCAAIGKLMRKNVFSQIYIPPAAGDAGGAIGAALAANYIYFDTERNLTIEPKCFQGSYLGPLILDSEIEALNNSFNLNHLSYTSFDELIDFVVDKLSKGYIIGWVQGRMEFGARALGNRSILADPRDRDMQRRMNIDIKFRESFRPFAPAIRVENMSTYFELESPSPYMNIVTYLKSEYRHELPNDFQNFSTQEKINFKKSNLLPSTTHIDFTARVQTVDRNTNPKFWELLRRFEEKTSCGVLINTSFNRRGEPIVCNAKEALDCFTNSEMDFLVIENTIYSKFNLAD